MEELATVVYTKFTLDKRYKDSVNQLEGYSCTQTTTFFVSQKQTANVLPEVELTQHAMRLATSALAEDWENEEDAYWEAYLDK
jgi:hypothetical protein